MSIPSLQHFAPVSSMPGRADVGLDDLRSELAEAKWLHATEVEARLSAGRSEDLRARRHR